MPKRIPLTDSLTVDGTDLSNFARAVRRNSEHTREDASGFNAKGVDEYIAGSTAQSLVVEFFGSYGASEVHATLNPIHKNREIVPIAWRPDMNTPASATNPEARGNVQLFNYSPGGTRGEVDTFEVTFYPADEDGIEFFDTPLP